MYVGASSTAIMKSVQRTEDHPEFEECGPWSEKYLKATNAVVIPKKSSGCGL